MNENAILTEIEKVLRDRGHGIFIQAHGPNVLVGVVDVRHGDMPLESFESATLELAFLRLVSR